MTTTTCSAPPEPIDTANELVEILYNILADHVTGDPTPLEVLKRATKLRKLWRADQPRPQPSWIDFCLECHTPYPRTHLPWETRGGVDVLSCPCNDQHSMVRYHALDAEGAVSVPGEVLVARNCPCE